MSTDILIVDDELDIRSLVSDLLEDEGYSTAVASKDIEAFELLEQRFPSLVILDIWLEGSQLDGLQILAKIKEYNKDIPVIMMSGHGNIETAVQALKLGAYDFIEKPFQADRLLVFVERALEAAKLRQENTQLKQKIGADEINLIGKSPAAQQLKQIINRAAPTESRILISGPAGSGKEIVARLIHQGSARKEAPFVIVNCAAMHPDRLEEELFGTEYLTADGQRKIGMLEKAHGGSLLLDEVGDLPLATQGKIVRTLQDQTFMRLGGSKAIKVNVRVLASTSHDLKKLIEEGSFREDLYYRLNVIPIQVPSLLERRADILAFVEKFSERPFSKEALAALQTYGWPGNVRQLKNVIEWVHIMTDPTSSDPIKADQLPQEIITSSPVAENFQNVAEIMGLPIKDARDRFERDYLLSQINRFEGNISKTASFIGMERAALHRKLKSLGVSMEMAS